MIFHLDSTVLLDGQTTQMSMNLTGELLMRLRICPGLKVLITQYLDTTVLQVNSTKAKALMSLSKNLMMKMFMESVKLITKTKKERSSLNE
jgi:hypothetical protein